jgi:FMN phosphatase YigB (HAD superfamily)
MEMQESNRVIFFDAEGTLYKPREGKTCSDFWDGGEHTLERAVEHFKLNDGVLETLITLRRMGCTMVVVSKHRPELLPNLLEGLGIKRFFADIIINGDKGENMVRFLEKFGVTKDMALLVGDSPSDDIEPARRVGVKGYLLGGRDLHRISELISLIENR